jgi:ribosomal protein S18 acetylase RimI-like enzyme
MADTGYRLEVGTPAPDQFCRLRVAAGLSAKTEQAAAVGLPNTFYGVTVLYGDELVGMGRVIGDGALFFQLVDIAVEPAHQGRGLGKMIVRSIVEHLRKTAPGAYVSLIADGPARFLYAQFGFTETAPASIGMALKV